MLQPCKDILQVIVLSRCSSYYWFNPLAHIFVYINFSPLLPSPPTRPLFPSLSYPFLLLFWLLWASLRPLILLHLCVFFPLTFPPPSLCCPTAQGCVPCPSGHYVLEVRPAHHLPHRPAAGQGGRDAERADGGG